MIKLQENGFRPYLVGGCVRDFFLNKQIKDFDIEVFNLEFLENIIPLLEKFGNVNCVGKSFGVLKLSTKNFEFDFSLPRTEQKIGKTHKDFIVKTYSKLSFECKLIKFLSNNYRKHNQIRFYNLNIFHLNLC